MAKSVTTLRPVVNNDGSAGKVALITGQLAASELLRGTHGGVGSEGSSYGATSALSVSIMPKIHVKFHSCPMPFGNRLPRLGGQSRSSGPGCTAAPKETFVPGVNAGGLSHGR
jgi:hypothetical protein